MTPKLFIINILLGILLAVILVKTYGVWKWDEGSLVAPLTRKASLKLPHVPGIRAYAESEAAYGTITKHNLFSNDRREYVAEAPQEEKPLVVDNRIQGKKIVLYGVVLFQNRKSALISNPVSGKDAQPYVWVREGEHIGGLKMVEIEKDFAVLRERGQTYRILLHGADRDRDRAGAPAGARKVEKARVIVTQPAPAESHPQTPQAVRKKADADEGFETVNTPFGVMKLRKR
jgi:type II secretory pathway component PulC